MSELVRVLTVGVLELGLLGAFESLNAAPVTSGSPSRSTSTQADKCADAAVSVGARLFAERRLSSDGQVSCATCHQPDRAFSDGRPVARGIGGLLGTRNTPTLLDAAFSNTFSWDGRRTSLEQQVLDPLVNSREHGLTSHRALLDIIEADPDLVVEFGRMSRTTRKAVSLEQVAHALACYVRTLAAGDSDFDRFMYKGERAALTQRQQRGLKLFQGRGQCASCHLIGDRDAPFTDHRFHALHLEADVRRDLPALVALVRATPHEKLGELIASRSDVAALGRFLVTRDPTDLGRFRTPSLRNVALTAPYMHDGSVPTLARAVERELYYRNAEAARPTGLTPAELDDLVAFLESLTSTTYATRYGTQTAGSPAPRP